jgi:hypothetical protein
MPDWLYIREYNPNDPNQVETRLMHAPRKWIPDSTAPKGYVKSSMYYPMALSLAKEYGLASANLTMEPTWIFSDENLFTPYMRFMFFGHSHIPFAYVKGLDGEVREFIPQSERRVDLKTGKQVHTIKNILTIKDGEKAIVSPGAVGVARGGDYVLLQNAKLQGMRILPAHYAILENMSVEFIELYYNPTHIMEATKKAGMPDVFAAQVKPIQIKTR